MSYQNPKKTTHLPIGINDLDLPSPKRTRQKLSQTPRQLQSEEDTAKLLSQSFYKLSKNTDESISEEFDQSINANEEEGQLSVDIFQTNSHIVIVAPVAGVSRNNLSLSITDDILSIKGARTLPIAVPAQDYFTQECFWGHFSRSIVLPPSINKNSIKAEFKDGVLVVRMPKTENVKTRIIKINS